MSLGKVAGRSIWTSVIAFSSVLLLATVSLSACSDEGEDAAKRVESACSDEDSPSTTTISDECADALFAEKMLTVDDEIKQISDEQRIEFIEEVCEAAEAIADGTSARPLRSSVVAETTKDWGLGAAAAEELFDSAEYVCPSEFAVIQSLPSAAATARVILRVEGTGPIEITHTAEDGSTVTEDGSAPWALPLMLSDASEIDLRAEGDDAEKLSCSITVGEAEPVTSEADDGEDSVSCEMSASAVERAANANS